MNIKPCEHTHGHTTGAPTHTRTTLHAHATGALRARYTHGHTTGAPTHTRTTLHAHATGALRARYTRGHTTCASTRVHTYPHEPRHITDTHTNTHTCAQPHNITDTRAILAKLTGRARGCRRGGTGRPPSADWPQSPLRPGIRGETQPRMEGTEGESALDHQ